MSEQGKPEHSRSKGLIIDLGPKAQAQTSIGTVYVYDGGWAATDAYAKQPSGDTLTHIRSYLAGSCSTFERRNAESASFLQLDQVNTLTDDDIERLATAY